jgi:hypothetical protein
MSMVKQARDIADPNPGFRKQLKALETEIKEFEAIAKEALEREMV